MNSEIKELFKKMERNKLAMLQLLQNWTEEELKSRAYGDWCALEVVDHVIISERGTLGYMMKKTSGGWENIPLADESNKSEAEALNENLVSEKKWTAPTVLPHPTAERSLDDMTDFWSGLRIKYLNFLDELDDNFNERQVFNHPYSGRMNLYHTLDFLANHIHHHNHQLKRIREQLDAQ